MAYRLGFIMEQTLGHVTHAKNLQYWIERDPEVNADLDPGVLRSARQVGQDTPRQEQLDAEVEPAGARAGAWPRCARRSSTACSSTRRSPPCSRTT